MRRRRSLRHRSIFRRDGNRCQYCDKPLGPRNRTVDHLTPRSKGGPDKDYNLVASCIDCNAAKGNSLPLEFLWQRAARLAGVA